MNAPSVAALRRPDRSKPPLAGIAVGVLALLLVGAMVVKVAPSLSTPPTVARVTIVNPHQWHAEVEVAGGDQTGWIGLGTASREQRRSFDEVIDREGTWVFRFSYAGETVQLAVDRSTLRAASWTVTVPEEFAERLTAAGVQESA